MTLFLTIPELPLSPAHTLNYSIYQQVMTALKTLAIQITIYFKQEGAFLSTLTYPLHS